MHSAAALFDVKAFDHVDLEVLATCAIDLGFPKALLRFLIRLYRARRTVVIGRAVVAAVELVRSATKEVELGWESQVANLLKRAISLQRSRRDFPQVAAQRETVANSE